MSDISDRCPLCGSEGTTQHHTDPLDEYCLNPDCNLSVRQWPRVAELMAIRDAAVAWATVDTVSRYWEFSRNKLLKLARQEAENGVKNVRK